MSYFVFKTALWVAVETMHFSIAQTKHFWGNVFFRIQGIQLNNLVHSVPMKNCPGGDAS